MRSRSELLMNSLGILYPIIFLFGIYITINGHSTPGGGFQGGAIISSTFIIQYIINPELEVSLSRLQKIEKILFLCIILIVTIFVIHLNGTSIPLLNQIYLIIMNILIATKVYCGLSIIFFRFVLFESR
ncbi:MnhB domain-containing protein [Vallitalea sp.]|jgi:multicomponent Na+:H+ antiporter subunit B|uniref:MnhB domain-containing protein n=1 Tax=Vallitalea sp. TaxID=1882829 RepID=UPI0025FF65D6|nr:MnhB domain-containing protein [Vallitalea sp.]MCT4686413.1 sodium:proton antiporter [Vallitalea sp.]